MVTGWSKLLLVWSTDKSLTKQFKKLHLLTHLKTATNRWFAAIAADLHVLNIWNSIKLYIFIQAGVQGVPLRQQARNVASNPFTV